MATAALFADVAVLVSVLLLQLTLLESLRLLYGAPEGSKASDHHLSCSNQSGVGVDRIRAGFGTIQADFDHGGSLGQIWARFGADAWAEIWAGHVELNNSWAWQLPAAGVHDSSSGERARAG